MIQKYQSDKKIGVKLVIVQIIKQKESEDGNLHRFCYFHESISCRENKSHKILLCGANF